LDLIVHHHKASWISNDNFLWIKLDLYILHFFSKW
jgi:hypothetical protein